jgi:hypothetical protein
VAAAAISMDYVHFAATLQCVRPADPAEDLATSRIHARIRHRPHNKSRTSARPDIFLPSTLSRESVGTAGADRSANAST